MSTPSPTRETTRTTEARCRPRSRCSRNGPGQFKSSYSGSGGGDCVEVAVGPEAVYVRDSKAAGEGPVPRVSREERVAFVSFAADGAGLDV
ncbi:DUF397 domain-containing protein [Streptomyces sp. KK5PA1]|uniref:DUF397 domain-containing protein n=1 Tax=Actinacidiphila acididurans TaxID=2784346 RepID=A0ABS2U3J9_9ACTN|nr:DUF397 domain-containing protein [Actinacidiphila acididurans]